MKLLVRALTGAAYVAVMVLGTVIGTWTLLALIVLLAVLAVWELAHICTTDGRHRANRLLLTFSALALPAAMWVCCQWPDANAVLTFAPYLTVLVAMFVTELYARHDDAIGNLGLLALSQVYVVLPLSLLAVLAFAPLQAEGRPFWSLPLGSPLRIKLQK